MTREERPPVIVYVSSSCHRCEQVRELLASAGVAFVTRVVDEDDTAYDELLALGFRAVPVTCIGNRAIRGYNPDTLHAALSEAGRR